MQLAAKACQETKACQAVVVRQELPVHQDCPRNKLHNPALPANRVRVARPVHLHNLARPDGMVMKVPQATMQSIVRVRQQTNWQVIRKQHLRRNPTTHR
jgi:hypothetical protein